MQKHIKANALRLFPVLLLFTLCAGICLAPIRTEASWVDRDGSGIYEGTIEGGIDEDVDEDAGDGVEDEGSNWVMEMLTSIIKALPIALGDGIFGVLSILGASLDSIVYGRLVSSNSFFAFGLESGNIYGIVGAAVYNVLRGVTLLGCMLVFMVKVVESSWKRGQFALGSLKDAISLLLLNVLLLALMPNFVDVGLFLRDNILYLVASEGSQALFGSSSISIIGVLRDAAADGIVNAFMYFAAVILNVYFMANYVLIACSMVVNFVFFPLVVLKSYFDRQVLSNWTWEMVSCALIPIIDATLLMIPIYVGVYSDQMGVDNRVVLSMLQVILCWTILSAREMARYLLGIRINPMERASNGLSAFMAMHAVRGFKEAIGDWQEGRENAAADEHRADLEDELAQFDTEEAMRANRERANAEAAAFAAANGFGSQYPGEEGDGQGVDSIKAQDMYGDANGEREAKRAEDFLNYDNGSDFGMEQSYAENMQTHADAEDLPTVDEIEEQLDKAQKQREQLQTEYEAVQNDASLADEERDQRLNNLSKQMDKNDALQEKLINQKAQLRARQEEEDLSQDPVNLRKELAKVGQEKEELIDERQALVRQRNKLKKEQDELGTDSEKYKDLDGQIQKTDEAIRDIDSRIGSYTGRQKAISSALAKQERGLYDRQAYNLSERMKAQESLEQAEGTVKDCSARLQALKADEAAGKKINPSMRRELTNRMKDGNRRAAEARQRLADLSVEDARINEKLSEINPDRNRYSIDDLQKAKSAQQVRRASAQSQIAVLNAEIDGMNASDPQKKIDIEEKRKKILNLTAEAADANLQSARLDQMISGLKIASGSSAPRQAVNGRRGVISDEYDKKRRAIMERYATIDNFDEPQFADISREKRADLLRERALKTRRRAWSKGIGRGVGAAAGGMAGLWFGPTGMVLGSMAGGEIGSAAVSMGYGVKEMGGKVIDLKNRKKPLPPLELHVSSDLHGNSASAQKEIVQRVLTHLDNALDGELYEKEFTKELVQQNIKKAQVGKLLKKYNIRNAAEYERMLPQLRKEFPSMVVSGMQEKELQILEKCAGDEYINLSDRVKQRIVRRAVTERRSSLQEMNEVQIEAYLPDKWESGLLKW